MLKHAAERDEAAKKKVAAKQQPAWMLPLGATLGVFAAYLLIFSPPWLELNPIPPPPLAAQIEDLRTGMYLEGIVPIETYRISNGRLPDTLGEAGVGIPGLDYTVQGDSSYVLISSIGDETLVFNSAQDDPNEWVGNLAAKIGG